jgi:hypothetical protein
VKSEGSGVMKEEDYYTILPVAEKANPSGIIKHAPPDQAEDDDPIQPPEGAADSIEEFFYGWEDPQPEAPIPQLRRSSRIPKPTERYRCLIGDPSHLPTSTTNAEESSSPPTRYLVRKISLSNKHCHQKNRTSGDQQWTTNMYL